MGAKRMNEIDKFEQWLTNEARVYSKENPYKMKIVLDGSQVRRRLRALVKTAFKLGLSHYRTSGERDFREKFGFCPKYPYK